MPVVNVYNRAFADYLIGVSRYNAKPFNPFKTYLLLTLGTKFTGTSTLANIVEAELPIKNGYARIPYRIGSPQKIQSVDADSNVFKTYNPTPLTEGQSIYFLSDTDNLNLPTTLVALSSGVPYYLLNVDPGSGQFQISATPGGAAIDIIGSSAEFYIAKAGIWNTVSNRYDSTVDSLLLTAGTLPLSFDTTVVVHSTTSWGSYDIVNIDTGPDEFYTQYTHQIQENDLVYFTASTGGSLPSASGTTLAGRKTFKAKNVTGKKFKISEDDASTVALTSAGSGVIKVFSASGNWEEAVRQDSIDANLPVIIPANQTWQFTQQVTTSFS